MYHPLNLRSLLTLLVLLLPGLVHGLPEDRDKPIQLEADRGQLDQKTGTSIYEGNVIIIQGTLHLNADTATIYTKDGQFQRIESVGKPATWRYKTAPDKEELRGSGLHVDYDVTKNLMSSYGNARVTQGDDVFTGDYIDYDTKTDLVKARGENGKRIQITIQPKSPLTGSKAQQQPQTTAPDAKSKKSKATTPPDKTPSQPPPAPPAPATKP
jgi:lipopolysaccharide export system protein LptA